ncbi:reverse transcriptase domain-containing protein [Tanacetum coccineum]
MFSKFLSKYYPYSKVLQLRKDILNFQQLPTESVFEAWERFKSCLRKSPDHRILLNDQILTIYHGITMIDRYKIMVAAGGNIMRKTPQEAYDLIENMTQYHYQRDSEVHEQVEVLGNDTGYTIQSVQHQLGPGHPNTFHYTYSDESDEDEPSKDEPSEAKKSEIDPLIREPSDTFLIGDKEIKFNPLKDIDDPFPILKVSKKPLDSLDPISKTFDIIITNPLFDFEYEFTLYSDNPIFDIQNEKSDESETETTMEEMQIHSSQSTVQIPPPYGKLTIPSDKSKVHIGVLSVLWGNRLSFPDGSFPLTQKLKDFTTRNLAIIKCAKDYKQSKNGDFRMIFDNVFMFIEELCLAQLAQASPLSSYPTGLGFEPCLGQVLQPLPVPHQLPPGETWTRSQVDQGSQIKMIQVKEMMQDNDLKNSKSKDKGSKSRSQSMDEQSHYKQDKTITRQSINVKRHIFNVIGGTEEFEERDLNIGGDSQVKPSPARLESPSAKIARDPLSPRGGYMAASNMSALQVRGSEFQLIGARHVYTVIRKRQLSYTFSEASRGNHCQSLENYYWMMGV